MPKRPNTLGPKRRDLLIVEHMAMVPRIAQTVRHMFVPHIPFEDLVQWGYVGLVQAAHRYDPAQGSFARFAYLRIRGAIIDANKRQAYREELHTSIDERRNSSWRIAW